MASAVQLPKLQWVLVLEDRIFPEISDTKWLKIEFWRKGKKENWRTQLLFCFQGQWVPVVGTWDAQLGSGEMWPEWERLGFECSRELVYLACTKPWLQVSALKKRKKKAGTEGSTNHWLQAKHEKPNSSWGGLCLWSQTKKELKTGVQDHSKLYREWEASQPELHRLISKSNNSNNIKPKSISG